MATESRISAQPFPVAMASQAPPMPLIEAGVLRRIRMPMWAMRLCKVVRRNGIATQSVFPSGDHFHMARIHAATIPAKVIGSHTRRNGAAKHLISDAVRHFWYSSFHGVTAVAVDANSLPFPADCIRADSNLGPKALDLIDWKKSTRDFISHGNRIPCLDGGVR